MKKYLRFAVYMFMTFFCLTFVSCSSDDDYNEDINYLPNGRVEGSYPLSGTTIEINGVKYSGVSGYFSENVWNTTEVNENRLKLVFLERHVGNTYYWKEEVFCFTFSQQPKVKDNLAQKEIFLKHLPNDHLASGEFLLADNSGPAKVVNIDETKSTMTIKFENFKTTNGSFTYTFNGEITVQYRYEKSETN